MTAPLVPADVDLRGYEFMPLYGHHLFGSDFNARVTDAGWRAALTLWWAAWNQVPAASLPADDIALTRLADLGRDVKSFRKIKGEALHGFVECDDGRLYHKALAGWALEAWDRRVKERDRKAKWRESRQRDKDVPETGTGSVTKQGQDTGPRRDVPAEGKRSDSEVKRSDSELANRDVERTPGSTAGTGDSHGANGKTAFKGQDWDSAAYVAASAQTLGVDRLEGESQDNFRDRVFTAAQAKIREGKAETKRREAH